MPGSLALLDIEIIRPLMYDILITNNKDVEARAVERRLTAVVYYVLCLLYIYIYIYAHTHTLHIYIYIYMHIHTHMLFTMSVSMYMYICIYMYTRIYIYIRWRRGACCGASPYGRGFSGGVSSETPVPYQSYTKKNRSHGLSSMCPTSVPRPELGARRRLWTVSRPL